MQLIKKERESTKEEARERGHQNRGLGRRDKREVTAAECLRG